MVRECPRIGETRDLFDSSQTNVCMHALPVSRVQMVGQEGVLRDTHHLHVSQYCRSEPHPVLVFRVLCGRVCVHVRVCIESIRLCNTEPTFSLTSLI